MHQIGAPSAYQWHKNLPAVAHSEYCISIAELCTCLLMHTCVFSWVSISFCSVSSDTLLTALKKINIWSLLQSNSCCPLLLTRCLFHGQIKAFFTSVFLVLKVYALEELHLRIFGTFWRTYLPLKGQAREQRGDEDIDDHVGSTFNRFTKTCWGTALNVAKLQ